MSIEETIIRLKMLLKPIKVKLFNIEIDVKQEDYYPHLRPILKAIESAIDYLSDLKWYKSQDLIKREDVKKALANQFHCEFRLINEIPKAESPREFLNKNLNINKRSCYHNQENIRG